jgi:hypothetical protein
MNKIDVEKDLVDNMESLKIREEYFFVVTEDIPQLFVTTINTLIMGRSLKFSQYSAPIMSIISIAMKKGKGVKVAGYACMVPVFIVIVA